MLMIPTGKHATQVADLPRGPQFLAATLWDGHVSPDVISQRAMTWLKAVVRPARDVTVALESIAWAQGLPFLGKILPADDWRALAELLSSLPTDVDPQVLQDKPLVHQLLAVELVWTIAGRLPDAAFSSRLAKSGRTAISLGLSQILDRQGMLAAKHFRSLRSLLACWTRCRALARDLSEAGWGARAEQRYQRLVRNALRCNRPDGMPLLAGAVTDVKTGTDWGRELFESALQSDADETNRCLAATALPDSTPNVAARPPKKSDVLPPSSICFEDGGIAILRRNWNRDDERIAVLFSGQSSEIELVSSGRVVASGAWRFGITQQGRQLEPVSDWEVSCWYTDADVDYLELEIEVTGGVKLERQIVLAREDRFLLLADAVMSPRRCDLEYRSVLPLAPGIEFHGARESREGFLAQCKAVRDSAARPTRAARSHERVSVRGGATVGEKTADARSLAQVMPLALPEWRVEQSTGELRAVPEGLELHQATAGQRLFAPLFIDLDRSRFRRRMTWRQLTVAERLSPAPSDVAVGFRVAIGDQQWIIYRSLSARGNRTLLGHNLATDSLVARFGKDGEVTSIVEIE